MQGSGHLLAFVRQNRQQQLQKRSGRSSDKIGKKNLALTPVADPIKQFFLLS